MAKEMNMETLMKKLKTVSNTQDSIPMLSLWIIHHKSHHKQIVETWLNMLKKSKNNHRLTLLYLCNDVVQNCTRKNAPIYKESFSDVLAEAVTHLRDSSIKPSVQRVVKIWSKRSVFDTDFTDQLLASLITNTAPEKLRNKLLVEYKTSNLIDEIKKFKVIEDEIESDQIRLKAIRMDVSNLDAIRKLKDKIGGEKFSKEFEESATQLELFLKRYETYIEGRKSLLDLLDHGTVYYHAQYHEAKIVVNAYKNFENRVNKMKHGVDKVKEKFPPLPEEQVKSQGEDMEMSDEDENARKSSIISVDKKPRKIVKTSDKLSSMPIPSTEDTNSTSKVIKLLAGGLENLKNSNENASESLKRAMGGLMKRPGMRGASFNSTSDTTTSVVTKNENSKNSLTIVRTVAENTENNTRSISTQPSPPTGVESPPSPTGSPELNISSPPRMQSLDSRLADLFSEDGSNTEVKRLVREASESDSDSDTDLIKRANRLLDMKSDDVLPGLGDLDQVTDPTKQQKEVKDNEIIDLGIKSEVKTEIEIPVKQLSPKPSIPATMPVMIPVGNQSIPVIGGLSRLAVTIADGSSTPTLDEAPYSPPPKSYMPTTLPGGLPAPTYGGDALSFLTKIMGNSAKPDLSSAQNPPARTPPAVSQPSPVPANQIYGTWPPPSWPPANPPPVPSTISSNLWSSPPPLPTLPPPPVFSWPTNPDPTLPPPWQNLPSSATSLAQPTTAEPQSSSIVTTHNINSTNSNPSNTQPPNHIPFQRPSLPIFSVAPVTTAPPAAKKSKWDVKDTDYRASPLEPSPASSTSDTYLSSSNTVPERRNNLITVSSLDPPKDISRSKSISDVPLQPAFKTMPREINRQNFQPKPSLSPPRTQSHRVEGFDKTFDEKGDAELVAKQRLPHQPPLKSPTFHQHYDSLGNPASPRPHFNERENATSVEHARQFDVHGHLRPHHKHYDAHGRDITGLEISTIDQRIKEARLSSSSHPPLPRTLRMKSHPGNREFSDVRHPCGIRSPPPRNSFHPIDKSPVGPPMRRRSTHLIDVELAMMQDERRMEEEILREAMRLDEVERLVPSSRSWVPRPRPPPRGHPRPHFPPFRGMRPRMRF